MATTIHETSGSADFRLHKNSAFFNRNWFQLFILGVGIYILFNKDVSIEFGLGGSEMARSEASMPAKPQPAVAKPAKLEQHEHVRAADLKSEKPKEVPKANTMANLTPILSPTYAKRKGIPQEVVDQKLAICRNYIQKYAPVALQEMQKYGIPASITLAQGLLESNAGESRLARESQNHFGIKCRRKCRGCTCRNYSDDDIYDMFRVFDSAWESYREHSILLQNGRYKHLQKYGMDYEKWAHGLKKAGYATDKRYAYKLIQIIEFLNLDRYDRGGA